MEGQHFIHGKIAANVRMQHKESSRVPTHYLVPEVIDAPSSPQGAILLQVSDRYVVHLLHVLYESCHLPGLLIHTDQENLLDVRELGACLDVVLEQGHTGYGE